MIGATKLALTLACFAFASEKPQRSAEPEVPITPPSKLCKNSALHADDFCMDSERIEKLMMRDDFRVVHVGGPGRGTTDIKVVTLEFDDRGEKIRFRAKWKPSAEDGEGFNNNPRKEIAAYQLQKMFLTPKEYVVPPTVIRCFPLERVKKELQSPGALPTFPGTSCTMGILTYWMENVTDEHVFHEYRFERNANYRKAISHLNLFTYLIDHRDVHDGNFLISSDFDRPRAFSIDNGIAFSGLFNPMPMIQQLPNWSNIIVPSLPRQKIQVLREITRAQLDTLATAIQLAPKNGLLVEVKPEPPFDPDEGVRVRDGVVQLGLKREEIEGIEKRLKKLVEKVDEREIALFN
jgi:hypothetical protein